MKHAWLSLLAVLTAAVTVSIRGCTKPDDDAAFWWNWWVYAAAALAAFLAVAVALFIDKLRVFLSPPHLHLRIRQPHGNAADDRSPSRLQSPGTPGRWFHLRVWNSNRHVSTVHGVRVVVCEVWERRHGRLEQIWDEEVPVHWMHLDGTERTIGAPAYADLCSVIKERPFVRIETRIEVFSMIPTRDIPVGITRIVVFRARGHEADSERFAVQISWDGQWDDDAERLAEHLKVLPVDDPAPERE